MLQKCKGCDQILFLLIVAVQIHWTVFDTEAIHSTIPGLAGINKLAGLVGKKYIKYRSIFAIHIIYFTFLLTSIEPKITAQQWNSNEGMIP